MVLPTSTPYYAPSKITSGLHPILGLGSKAQQDKHHRKVPYTKLDRPDLSSRLTIKSITLSSQVSSTPSPINRQISKFNSATAPSTEDANLSRVPVKEMAESAQKGLANFLTRSTFHHSAASPSLRPSPFMAPMVIDLPSQTFNEKPEQRAVPNNLLSLHTNSSIKPKGSTPKFAYPGTVAPPQSDAFILDRQGNSSNSQRHSSPVPMEIEPSLEVSIPSTLYAYTKNGSKFTMSQKGSPDFASIECKPMQQKEQVFNIEQDTKIMIIASAKKKGSTKQHNDFIGVCSISNKGEDFLKWMVQEIVKCDGKESFQFRMYNIKLPPNEFEEVESYLLSLTTPHGIKPIFGKHQLKDHEKIGIITGCTYINTK